MICSRPPDPAPALCVFRQGGFLARSFRSLYGAQASLFFMVLFNLGGCAVGPNYRRPSVTMTPFHNAMLESVRSPGSHSLVRIDRWWEGFHDKELSRLVERVLAQNLDLDASYARVRQADASAASAAARLLPTLDFNSSAAATHQSLWSRFGRIGSTIPGYSRDQRLYDVGAAASWEIDVFGGLRRGREAARAEAQAADALQTGVRITVVADAVDAYLQIRGAQAQLLFARQMVRNRARELDLVKIRRARGAVDDRDIVNGVAALDDAKKALPLLEIAREVQLNRLDVLSGVQPGTSAKELAETASVPDPPAIPPGDSPTDVLRRRPDVIAAERRLAAANARIGQVLSDYYPKISLSGLVGFESLRANKMFTPAGFQPLGEGALRWRIFDFGKIDAEVANATGARAEALASYRKSILQAVEDVEDALMSFDRTHERVEELADKVSNLRHFAALSDDNFRAGSESLSPVLEAEFHLLSSESELVDSRVQSAQAAVRTFRALGGGWTL
ncbi:efflux transporter outer membrane subunit [Gluconacetobacter sp. Hr-1-5]|uniref:efflux transporter outer membrane subunit n=1 Tax=Gluconacetobacter sp. Hr-1-5 TaxID=3395370 RepID=UPI003B51DCA3